MRLNELVRLSPGGRRKAEFCFVVAVNVGAFALLTNGAVSAWSANSPPPLNDEAPSAPPDLDTQALAGSGIFGGAPASGENGEDSPLQDLRLSLKGIVTLKGGGLALFSINGAAAEPFELGQEIRAGAVLEKLYDDRAVIRRGDESETVILAGPRVAKKVVEAPSGRRGAKP